MANLNTTAPLTTSATLSFSPTFNDAASEYIFVGRSLSADSIVSKLNCGDACRDIVEAMLSSIDGPGSATTFLPAKVSVVLLPAAANITRNNHPFSPHKLTEALCGLNLDTSGIAKSVQILVLDDEMGRYVVPVATAISRALPLYHSKSSEVSVEVADDAGVSVSFHQGGAMVTDDELYRSATAVSEGVRMAARLGDMPPAELNPDTYSAECRAIASKLKSDGHNVTITETVGDDLKEQGYGGIFGVGQAAAQPPRLVVMSYTPAGESLEHIALCGKGVCYDTGGLSLKPKSGMPGMKHDMGGSAGCLAAFQAAVTLKLPRKLTLVLALVENSINQHALRNDDIITMKSGRTVEINNTDAEGRLILGDCVSHASNSLDSTPDIIYDQATLTGAQLVAVGKKHAGILAKSKELEDRMVDAGLSSGDLCFPLLYAPELLKSEFKSQVADMKNSVKDRGNAQCSCAGHFIESHLDESYQNDYVHCDMAGPQDRNERATGYGVALILGLLKAPGFC